MASSSVAIITLLVATWAGVATATSFDVGDGHGWEVGIDYTDWTSGKTFAVGDTLVFNYTSKAHTVMEVSKSGYDTCTGTTSLSSDNSGSTTITLTTVGVHYFICNVDSHCLGGMKLAVTVVEGTSTGSMLPSGGAALSALLPAMSAVVAAAAGALIVLALF